MLHALKVHSLSLKITTRFWIDHRWILDLMVIFSSTSGSVHFGERVYTWECGLRSAFNISHMLNYVFLASVWEVNLLLLWAIVCVKFRF